MHFKKNHNHILLIVLSCCLLITVSAFTSVLASPVAMITDKTGDISLKPHIKLDMFAEIEAGSQLQIAKSAKLTLVYLNSGKEYVFSGPKTIVVAKTGPQINNKKITPSQIFNKTAKIAHSSAQYSQAAIIMRSGNKQPEKLQIIYPKESKILTPWPTLSWQSMGKGYSYRVEVLTADGDSLFVTKSQSNKAPIPKQIKLPKNTLLSWEIEAIKGNQVDYNSATFFIVDAQTAKKIKSSQPKGNSFSQLAFYARTLEKKGFNYEAKKYWSKLAKKRPNDPNIQAKIRP